MLSMEKGPQNQFSIAVFEPLCRIQNGVSCLMFLMTLKATLSINANQPVERH